MSNESYIALSESVIELQQLCQAHCSGTFLLTTDLQNVAQFNLKDGIITFIAYQGRCGMDALAPFKDIKQVKTRFLSHSKTTVNSGLPANEVIFQNLVGAAAGNTQKLDSAHHRANHTAKHVTQKIATPPSVSQTPLSEKTKSHIESALVRVVGPLAKAVCAELWDTQPDFDAALQFILIQLADPAKAAQFLNEISTLLGDVPPASPLSSAPASRGAVAKTANATPASSSEHLPQRVKTVLERTLAEFMGPAAVLVCADHLRKAADTERAIHALAQEITNSKLAQHFIQRAHERLAVVL